MHRRWIQILSSPIPSNLHLLAIVQPLQLSTGSCQKVLQRIQIGQALRRRTQQLRVQLLQLTQTLLVQMQLIAAEVRLLAFAVRHLRVELIDDAMFLLVSIEFGMNRWVIGAVVGRLELFEFGLAPFGVLLQILEVRICVDGTGFDDGARLLGDGRFLDGISEAGQFLDQIGVKCGAQLGPALVELGNPGR